MLDKILWGIFYVITAVIILFFLFKEKKVTEILENVSDAFSSRIEIKKEINKNVIIGLNIFNCFVVGGIFIFFVDKTASDILPLKQVALYVVVIANIVLLLLNKKKEYLFVLNIIMLFIGVNIFGIYDKSFNLSMALSVPLLLISIYLEKEDFRKRCRFLINAIFLLILITILQSHYLGNYVIPTQSMEPTILTKDRIFSNNIIYKFENPKLNDIISFEEPLNNQVMYTKRITGVAGTIFKIQDNKIYSNNLKISDRYYNNGKDSLYEILGQNEIYIPKKGDEVRIIKVLEFDSEAGKINILTPQEFLNKYRGQDYTKLVGLYNNITDRSITKRYTFIMQEKNHNELMLPILDFKYNKRRFEKLLSGQYEKLTDDYYMAMGDNTDNSEDSRYFGYVKKSRIRGKLFFRWMPFNRIGFMSNGN